MVHPGIEDRRYPQQRNGAFPTGGGVVVLLLFGLLMTLFIAGYTVWVGHQAQRIRMAINKPDLKAMRQLLRTGAPANIKGALGETPLVRALWGDDPALAHLALDRGAEVNTFCYGAPVIIWALHEDETLFGRIIATGADVNARDKQGMTALMRAARYGDVRKVKLLLQHGAHVNLRQSDQTTALMEAVEAGEVEAAEILLRHGADVGMRDRSGRTALDRMRVYQKKLATWF